MRPDNFTAAKIYFYFFYFLSFFGEVRRRKKIFSLVPKKDTFSLFSIPLEKGYLKLSLPDAVNVKNCVDHSKKIIQKTDFKLMAQKAKKPFLINLPFDLSKSGNEHIKEFAEHPLILKLIYDYLGIFPTVSYAAIWYSPNDTFMGRIQMYDIEGDEYRAVKIFLPLDIIDEATGALTFIPADETKISFQNLLKKQKIKRIQNQKVEDAVVFSEANPKSEIKLTGKPGDVIFLDTCSCWHYGSRPLETGNKPRILLHLHYVSPFNVTFPISPKATKITHDTNKVNTPEKELIRNALFGLSHLDMRYIYDIHNQGKSNY